MDFGKLFPEANEQKFSLRGVEVHKKLLHITTLQQAAHHSDDGKHTSQSQTTKH